MKIIKGIFYFLIALVVLILIIGLFLPSSFNVERSVVINMPVDSVFKQVDDFNNYAQWNPWLPLDPEAKTQVSDPCSGVGAQWSWEGEIIGKGQLTRLEVDNNKFIRSKLIFDDKEDNPSYNYWKFETTDGGTKVTWGMEGDLDYPVGRFIGLLMDGMIGADFEKGLASLKMRAESM